MTNPSEFFDEYDVIAKQIYNSKSLDDVNKIMPLLSMSLSSLKPETNFFLFQLYDLINDTPLPSLYEVKTLARKVLNSSVYVSDIQKGHCTKIIVNKIYTLQHRRTQQIIKIPIKVNTDKTNTTDTFIKESTLFQQKLDNFLTQPLN